MNLQKLFEAQKKLDARIVEEKGLKGRDLLPEKILALQVELGELANEWRGFKFWSEDREPHRVVTGDSMRCDECAYNNGDKDPLLEEYVDCLHFILSIGLSSQGSCDYESYYMPLVSTENDITAQFNSLFLSIVDFSTSGYLEVTIELFLGLGDLIGFTWEQIEQAYYDKNKINHERQENGY